MRRAVAIAVLGLAGCASEADVLLEVEPASATSMILVAICDAGHPEDCDDDGDFDPATLDAGRTVHQIAIYLDRAIDPPLTVTLKQIGPSDCVQIDLDPAAQSGTIDVVMAADATTEGSVECAGCTSVAPCD